MIHFILNKKSGHGLGLKVYKLIQKICAKRMVEYEMHFTEYAGHATVLANKISTDNKDDVIVAVGGDGTFHETLNGIVDPSLTALGLIPCGRGNDFARTVKLDKNVKKSLNVILDTTPKFIDYIQIGNKRCLNVAGTGLDVDVLKRVAGRNGKITYLKSLIYCLTHFNPYKLEVTANGQTTYHECIMAGVCNGTCFGGNIKLSPQSKIDDGLINLVVMRMPDDGKIMKVLPKFIKGKHLNLDITTHFTCEEVTITPKENISVELDGEIYSDLILNCKVIKGGLKTFLP